MTITTISLKCPNCGRVAEASLSRNAGSAAQSHAEVVYFHCPAGCRVDDEAIRQVSGTSST